MPVVSMPRWTRMGAERARHANSAREGGERRGLLALLALVLGLLFAPACAAPRETTELPADPLETLRTLAWLPGDWRQLDSSVPRGERWWYDGQELVGEAWVMDRDRRLLTEKLAIRIDAEGDGVEYVAEFPGREKPPVRFPLYELGRRAVAFENQAHGHPWRLAYEQGRTGLAVSVFYRDQPGAPSRVERLRFVRVEE